MVVLSFYNDPTLKQVWPKKDWPKFQRKHLCDDTLALFRAGMPLLNVELPGCVEASRRLTYHNMLEAME